MSVYNPIDIEASVRILSVPTKGLGLPVLFQTIPLAVMAEPPSEEIFPPLTAVVLVIEATGSVAIIGTKGLVLKLSSPP